MVLNGFTGLVASVLPIDHWMYVLTFHFLWSLFESSWLVFCCCFFSKNHWRQLVGWSCHSCLFSLIRLVGGVAVHFQKLVVGVDCLQSIYFALHGLSFKDVVVIFVDQVGGWLGCRWLLGTCVVTLVTLGSPCHAPPSCITLMIIATILHQSFLCIDIQNWK